MLFRLRFKPARKAAHDAPTLDQLSAYVTNCLADRYYGETFLSIAFVFCESETEARRLGVRRVYGEHLEVGVTAPPDVLDPRGQRACLTLVLDALERVRDALRVEDDLQIDALLADVARVHEVGTDDLSMAADTTSRSFRVRAVRARAAALRRSPRPLTSKLLRGIRVYDAFERGLLRHQELPPVSLVLDALVRARGVRTPGYDEIYVQLAPTVDDAIRSSTPGEPWHEYTYGALDESAFRAAEPAARARLYLVAVETALLEKAKDDHLDEGAFRDAFERLRAEGETIDLPFLERDLGSHFVCLSFRVAHRHEKRRLHFRIRVVRNSDGVEVTRELAEARSPEEATVRFATLKIVGGKLRIDARASSAASLWVKDAPKRIELSLVDLFAAG